MACAAWDNTLLDYGVRDVSVIVEDILDETKKVNCRHQGHADLGDL
jgi:hypothetical protein